MQITSTGHNVVKNNFLVYIAFIILSLLLFWPILHKSFVSDDFSILYRVTYEKDFFIRGFFRPLSDISLYSSYLMGGLNPVYYNISNVIIHASCAFLLYRFCLLSGFTTVRDADFFAWSSALLFLIYPFHNEAVIWAIGRGIVLSGFLGFLSLLVVFTNTGKVSKYLLSYLFYFLGLCSYEAVLPLPFIILILQYRKNKSFKSLVVPAAGYAITLVVNIFIRILVAGTILGEYGGKMFSPSLSENCIKFLKVAARLVLPPSGFSLLLSICFIILLICIILAGIAVVKKKNTQSGIFITLTLVTFFSCIIPGAFGISTKTYEGDRIFYFSSFFLCIWIAYLLSLFQNKKKRWGAGLCIIFYFLFFFYKSVLTWKESGRIAGDIISTVGNIEHRGRRVYLLNMPEEYNGAQVLRNGFKQALLINHIDTAGIRVINYLDTENALKLPGIIKPVEQQQSLFIYPAVLIRGDTLIAARDKKSVDSVFIKLHVTDKIYYWDKESFIFLPNPF